MTITMESGVQVRVAPGVDLSGLESGTEVTLILDDYNAVESFEMSNGQ